VIDASAKIHPRRSSTTLESRAPGPQEFSLTAGQPVQVVADLTWTPTSDLSRDLIHSANPRPVLEIVHQQPLSRSARASGSVVVGTTNLTPTPSELADLQSTKGGVVG
jgi:hypothetical protein